MRLRPGLCLPALLLALSLAAVPASADKWVSQYALGGDNISVGNEGGSIFGGSATIEWLGAFTATSGLSFSITGANLISATFSGTLSSNPFFLQAFVPLSLPNVTGGIFGPSSGGGAFGSFISGTWFGTKLTTGGATLSIFTLFGANASLAATISGLNPGAGNLTISASGTGFTNPGGAPITNFFFDLQGQEVDVAFEPGDPVPEPGAGLLGGSAIAALALGWLARRRRS